MLFLSQNEVKKILPLKDIKKVILAVEKAFFDYAISKVEMPAKLYLSFKKFDGDLRIMPCWSETLFLAGTKLVNVHPRNPQKNLPTVMAVIILHDPKNGIPLAMMDGTWITALRTGAASAVATKYLARKEAKTLGVVGAGFQALTQIVAISKVRKIKEIFVFDIKKERIKKLAKLLAKEKIKIKEEKLEKVCQCDILTTVTPARSPVVKKEWIRPGVHINAIGADAPGKQELDSEILREAKIVVDSFEQVRHSGEINIPLKEGIITKEKILGQLGEIIANKKRVREEEKDITIFDSTGLAVQDLYTAHIVYKMAKNKKIGREIKII